MNRKSFFQGLGAMLFGGQFVNVQKKDARADGSACKNSDALRWDTAGGRYCVKTEPDEPGEEKCPLGHVQKPHIYFFRAYLTLEAAEGFAGSGQFGEQHICSQCRIVYIPDKGKP